MSTSATSCNHFTLIRTVQNWRQTGGKFCCPRDRSKNTTSSFAECSRGVTESLAGEFRDWTMSLESTDIDRIGQVEHISLPRDRPLNNADHGERCACLSPPKGGILSEFYLPREPNRELPTLATLQGETVLLIASAYRENTTRYSAHVLNTDTRDLLFLRTSSYFP